MVHRLLITAALMTLQAAAYAQKPNPMVFLVADVGDDNRIGQGEWSFDAGPQRSESQQWLAAGPRVRRATPTGMDGGGPYPTRFTLTVAIPHESGVTRRDPSDVIQVGNMYYVWYSKVTKRPNVYAYPSGYSADVYYATSPDGHKWTEQGLAVGKGSQGAWDAHGVFTPNILAFKGRYSLYYTGVGAGHGKTTLTHIGVAISDSPAGPWLKFEGNPVLSPSTDSDKFDSMRVDDAALVVRGGKVWFYYKGRQRNHSPGQTKMGVAISDDPTGPFIKQLETKPLHSGHEVMIWPQGTGVASLATAAGPRKIYFAPDGLHFSPRNAVTKPPHAPGAFRNDAFHDGQVGHGLTWGISHASRAGDLYLVRFDCRYASDTTSTSSDQDHATSVGNLRFDVETGDAHGWTVLDGQPGTIVSDHQSLLK